MSRQRDKKKSRNNRKGKKLSEEEQEKKNERGRAKQGRKKNLTTGIIELESFDEDGMRYETMDIPYGIMSHMILQFKTNEFITKFKKKKNPISQGVFESRSSEQKSTYWMLNNTEVNVENFDWSKATALNVQERIAIGGIISMIQKALFEKIGIEYKDVKPGFVTTGEASHQLLHVNSKRAFANNVVGTCSMILHVPLSSEGLWLRLGLVVNGIFNEKIIFVPFGKGIMLPMYQYHAEHYGKKGNIRFHCIFSVDRWESNELGILRKYIIDRSEYKDDPEVVNRLLEDITKIHTSDFVHPEGAKGLDKFAETTYIENLNKHLGETAVFRNFVRNN